MTNLLAFPDESRVWVYQADRPFEDTDIPEAEADIDAFCSQWTSHDIQLRAIGGIMYGQFVILVVDETKVSTGGCSIDKSIYFIKNLENKFNRSLLQRDQIAYLDDKEQIHVIPLHDLKDALIKGKLSFDTRVFDNLVATRKDYVTRWVRPLGDTWMKKFTC